MSDSAHFEQVDEYISSKLGNTLRSGNGVSMDTSLNDHSDGSTGNLSFEQSEKKSGVNSNASNAQEVQTLQLKLKDSLVQLDQYKVKLEQQQQELGLFQLSSKIQLSGDKAQSGLDPEVNYLQQHVLTQNSRIETLENANKEVVYNNDLLTDEIKGLRHNIAGYQRDMQNHTKNTENLLVVCDQYKTQVEHFTSENAEKAQQLDEQMKQLEDQKYNYAELEKERDRYKEQSQNSQNDGEKLEYMEREFMQQSQGHQVQLTQLKNEALQHAQMHQELRVEYDTMQLQHKQRLQQVQNELEVTKNGLAYDLHALKTSSQRELEATKSHYQTSLQVIQQQLHSYKQVSSNIQKQQDVDFAKQMDELQRSHSSESALLLQWAQQQIHVLTIEKDNKIAGLQDNSGNEQISRLHQSELLRQHETHQHNLEDMRGRIAEGFKKEQDTLKRKLGRTQLELTTSVVENQELHTKVSSYWSQVLQSQQKTSRIQAQQNEKIGILQRNLETAKKELAEAVSAREKAIHDSMRLKLMVDGRQKGSVASSAIKLQSSLSHVYDEVSVLRQELQAKNEQLQHVLDSSSLSQQLYNDTKNRLDIVVKQFQRVLALLHTKQRGDSVDESELHECMNIVTQQESKNTNVLDSYNDIEKHAIELPNVTIQPVDVYNTSISKLESDINEDITKGVQFLTIHRQKNGGIHSNNNTTNSSSTGNIGNSSNNAFIQSTSATQAHTQLTKPSQPYKPVHAPLKQRPQQKPKAVPANPAGFVVSNAATLKSIAHESALVPPQPLTAPAADPNTPWFDE